MRASPEPTIQRFFSRVSHLPSLVARQRRALRLPVVCDSTPSLRISQGLWRVAAQSDGFQLLLWPLRVIGVFLFQAPVA
jgi:hypothetical protein